MIELKFIYNLLQILWSFNQRLKFIPIWCPGWAGPRAKLCPNLTWFRGGCNPVTFLPCSNEEFTLPPLKLTRGCTEFLEPLITVTVCWGTIMACWGWGTSCCNCCPIGTCCCRYCILTNGPWCPVWYAGADENCCILMLASCLFSLPILLILSLMSTPSISI